VAAISTRGMRSSFIASQMEIQARETGFESETGELF
jgi:hypothetical protein